jgi:predicted ATPase
VRHGHRRFGPGPYLTGLRKDPARWSEGFPYDVPAVDAVETLDLGTPVTLLAGDNGTGKSTIVEAIAEAMGFAAEGGELERSGELPAVPRKVLGEALEPVLTHTKPHTGYFLRAEACTCSTSRRPRCRSAARSRWSPSSCGPPRRGRSS